MRLQWLALVGREPRLAHKGQALVLAAALSGMAGVMEETAAILIFTLQVAQVLAATLEMVETELMVVVLELRAMGALVLAAAVAAAGLAAAAAEGVGHNFLEAGRVVQGALVRLLVLAVLAAAALGVLTVNGAALMEQRTQ